MIPIKESELQILQLLEDYFGTYTSPKKVTYYLNLTRTGSVSLCCNYPGYISNAKASLTLFKEFISSRHFFESVSVKNIMEFNDLSPNQLLKLFEKGILIVDCYISPNSPKDWNDKHITFFKKGKKLYAVDELEQCEVRTSLNKPEDFVNYTKKKSQQRQNLYRAFEYLPFLRPA